MRHVEHAVQVHRHDVLPILEQGIGIADERSYDELGATAVPLDAPPRWQRVSIDLSKYGGFRWSLFYRPRWKIWKVTFNTTVKGLGRGAGAADRLYWARPMVDEKG